MAGPLTAEELRAMAAVNWGLANKPFTSEQAERLLSQLTPEQKAAFQSLLEGMVKPKAAQPDNPAWTAPVGGESIGPVIDIDQTAWFQIGVRFKTNLGLGIHELSVSCDHCGESETFEAPGRDATPGQLSPRHIGEWMINHRRRHR